MRECRQELLLQPVGLTQLVRALLHDALELAGVPLEDLLLLMQVAAVLTRLYGASQRCQEVLALDRLLDEIVGPATQGQHGEVVVTVPGDQQRRRLRAKCSDLSEQSEPVHPRHLDVGNDGVVVRGVDLTEGARRRIAGVARDSLHPQLESLGKRLQQDDVVVHDQDTRHAHPAGCSDGSAVARGSSRTKVAPSAPSPFPNAIEPPYSLTMP